MVLGVTLPVADIRGWLSIIQIVVAIFTLVYAFDVLILHRKFRDLGKAMASNVSAFTIGIFILVLSLVIDSFDKAEMIATIGKIIGIAIIGIFFRRCVHSYIKKTGGEFWERIK